LTFSLLKIPRNTCKGGTVLDADMIQKKIRLAFYSRGRTKEDLGGRSETLDREASQQNWKTEDGLRRCLYNCEQNHSLSKKQYQDK